MTAVCPKCHPVQGIAVGILGGGQLAQMLAEAAQQLDLSPCVLTSVATDPAVAAASGLCLGSIDQADLLNDFVAQHRVTAFESEFVPAHALKLLAETPGGAIQPAPRAMLRVANKLAQKQVMEELDISTAAYVARRQDEAASAFLQRARLRFTDGCVLKWAYGGYDGKGNMVVRAEASEAVLSQAVTFIEHALQSSTDIYAEELIDFAHELAIVCSRRNQRDWMAFPVVFTEQRQNVCHRVWGPAQAFGVDAELEQRARGWGRKLGDSLPLVGTYAIEMFITGDGRLLANEIAPRVHNSGHFSQDAAGTSQFALHWLALLDRPLLTPSTAPYFGMLNMLGPDGISVHVSAPLLAKTEGVALHWYDKAEVRPGRKMGHVNVWADSRTEYNRRQQIAEHFLNQWQQQLMPSTKEPNS